MKVLKKFFKYIEPLWQGNDKKISLRNLGAMALLVDFVINVHNCSYVVIKVLKLIMTDKTVDAALISALAGYLAQTALILGIEAGLIAALLALKTYQNNVEFMKYNTPNNTVLPQQPAVMPGSVEQVNT